MTEENKAGDGQPQQQFAVQRIYLKDVSFETPLGVEAFKQEWKPSINQDMSTAVNKIDEHNMEVALTLTITAKLGEKTAFLVEVKQAGIFLASGFEDEQLARIANSTCPGILFPYAREAIDNLLTKGSFPALHLPPVNFDALFAQAMAQQAQKQESGEAESAH